MQKIVCVGVLGEIRHHRTNHAQVIRTLADLWEKVAHWDAALAVSPKLPRTTQRVPVVVELRRLHFHLERLAMLPVQKRLGIEGIDLRRTTVHIGRSRCAPWARDAADAERGVQISGASVVTTLPKVLSPSSARRGNAAKAIRCLAQHLAAADGRQRKRPQWCISIHEHKLFNIQHHMAKVGPDLLVLHAFGSGHPISFTLLVQKLNRLRQLLG